MDKVTKACLDCPDRVVGCHSKCERYKAYRDDIDSKHAAKDRTKDTDAYKRIKRDKFLHEAKLKGRYKDGGS